MPLVDLGEIWDGRSTIFSQEFRRVAAGSGDELVVQERKSVRVFQCVTDSALTDPNEVIVLAQLYAGAEVLPAIGTVHPTDPLSHLWTYEVVQQEAPEYWQIRCNYSTAPNPLDAPAEIEYDADGRERVLEGAVSFIYEDGSEEYPGDAGGHYPDLDPEEDLYPITNSALCPFSNPPTEQEYHLVITVTQNLTQEYYDPKWIMEEYVDRTNSESFLGFDAGTVLLPRPPRAKEQWDKNTGQFYIQSTWTFWMRPRGWTVKIADMGFRELIDPDDPGAGDREIYGELSGQPVQNEAKLDGAGRKAPLNQPTVFLEYRTKFEVNFNDIPFSFA